MRKLFAAGWTLVVVNVLIGNWFGAVMLASSLFLLMDDSTKGVR